MEGDRRTTARILRSTNLIYCAFCEGIVRDKGLVRELPGTGKYIHEELCLPLCRARDMDIGDRLIVEYRKLGKGTDS
jgi:hypothetical protein